MAKIKAENGKIKGVGETHSGNWDDTQRVGKMLVIRWSYEKALNIYQRLEILATAKIRRMIDLSSFIKNG